VSEDRIEGAFNGDAGKVETAVGKAIGNRELQARGGIDQAKGTIQAVAGKIQDAVGQTADKATETLSKVGDQTKEAYARMSQGTRQVANAVEPFVEERPYAALGLAAAVGVVVGLLLAGRGPRVIYVDSANPHGA
jgi:ElaB/YqjD/DUF883 family membrane-anchored ribosome-binding protein